MRKKKQRIFLWCAAKDIWASQISEVALKVSYDAFFKDHYFVYLVLQNTLRCFNIQKTHFQILYIIVGPKDNWASQISEVALRKELEQGKFPFPPSGQ